MRLVPTGLSPDAEQAAQPVEVGRSGGEVVEIHGRPSELLLFAFNRKADARLDLKGSAKAIDALQQAKLGL
ncbi:MAG: hypothetical protein JO222_02935 [Frankiales bacterium]|nr:hypothetical protein [Frankiales bacterium]